jgi:photosystem II stability/assembly factor-like uncharacterized protein
VDFIDPTTGWMIGSNSNDDAKGSKVYFTRDGGQSWTPLSTVNWNGAPDFVDAQTGWVIAASGNTASGNIASGNAASGNAAALVKSTNGGKSWIELSPKIAP